MDLNFCILIIYPQSAICQSCCLLSTMSICPLCLHLQAPSQVWVAVRGRDAITSKSKTALYSSDRLREDARTQGARGQQSHKARGPRLLSFTCGELHTGQHPLRCAVLHFYSLVFCQLSNTTVFSQISVFPQGQEAQCPESLSCRAAGSNFLERRIPC